MNRREFIKRSATALVAGRAAPGFLARAAAAARARNKILLIVQLTGGNDALNTLIPFKDARYYRSRPNLAIPSSEVLELENGLALHPELKPLLPFWDEGRLAFIPAVGYPDPNRSHFVSMAVWHTADPARKRHEGWLGNTIDSAKNRFFAVNFGNSTPAALVGKEHSAPSINSLRSFNLSLRKSQLAALHASLSEKRSGNTEGSRIAIKRLLADIDFLSAVKAAGNKALYPKNAFGRGLADIIAMVAGGVDSSVYYLKLSGFDTHSDQLNRQRKALQTLATGLSAFQQDLKNLGRQDDVLIMAFSEFGRRVAENASAGTDHGKGGLLFLLGPVAGGLLGSGYDLDDLDDGDLRYKVDFRQVYAAVVRHIGVPASAIFKNPPLPLDIYR